MFYTTPKRQLLSELTEVEDEIVPFRQTRNDTVVHQNKFVYYHDYLSGDSDAIKKIVDILSIREESVTTRFHEIILSSLQWLSY